MKISENLNKDVENTVQKRLSFEVLKIKYSSRFDKIYDQIYFNRFKA